MTRDSAHDLLVLHAVRVTGFADTPVLARRFGLDATATRETLYDAEARGWVPHTSAETAGWSLTERGKVENERRLAAELTAVGGTDEAREVHRVFLPPNAHLRLACTHWQLHPTATDRPAVNDHADPPGTPPS
ncbi:hypothetical protein [Actinomadura hibisca]|uniref:hypothetical protein n=1 Tax=Actinomadura hibisca TaxID=68565 RepID=UPI000A9F5A40|nr:hypothetical protein [Actinomadura hibisca]